MHSSRALIVVALLSAHTAAFAQYAPEHAPEAPPPPAAADISEQPRDGELVYEPGPSKEAPPPASAWTKPFPGGQWVYTAEYGWLWIPETSSPVAVDGVPYVFLYTPAYGWTWYVCPWGFGSFFYGAWVRHAWHPAGWHHGFIAHPRVIAVMPHHARVGASREPAHEHRR